MRHVILDDTGTQAGGAIRAGYPAAQVFAPAGETVICFEPMAAPTDALRRGGYRPARPGEQDTTVFSINVS